MVEKQFRMESPVGARTRIGGREVDYFSGTGYLGLQNHSEVIRATVDALQQYGFSTATSRGGYGEHPLYEKFEREACTYFGAEKTLYLPSGYMGVSVLTQASSGKFEHIFIDSDAHYSLWDAAYATNLPITPFHHCQVESLEEKLKGELRPGERPLLLSDGVFPISGEIAPLPDYLNLLHVFQGTVYLDDAHSVGVLGEYGQGTPDYFKIRDESCHTSGTLAKALGGYGGIIWGDLDWVKHLERESRIVLGSSPPPLPVAAASARALEIARQNPMLRQQLWSNALRVRKGLNQLGWILQDVPVPIICLGARADVDLIRIKKGLFEQGIAVSLVRSYTSTPPGGALRIAIFATHTEEQIDRLVLAISQLL